MSITTQNHRLQARWAPAAMAGGAAAAALSTRGVGRFVTCKKAMRGIDGASEPGRARFGRDDT